MRPALGYLMPAESEARTLGHNYVGTEHILLALLDRPGGAAAAALSRLGVSRGEVRDRLLGKLHGSGPRFDREALATLGIDLDRVRERVEQAFGPGALEQECMSIAPRAKMALQHAADEARGGPVRDDHVLVGLLSVEDSLAACVLTELGVSLADVRAALAG